MRIGFIGVGQMGRGMAARLIDRGYSLVVWNRTASAAEVLRAKGATVASHPKEALDSDLVITMLADDAAVEAVWIEPRLVGKLSASAVHLNMASVSLGMAHRLAALHRDAGAA